ncbi:hypothetical protein EIP91_003007 [Steccherinum ochraceum]|uniref:Uncharacterized protein n=1 Tax=Steccherinum ochraceum TaxID=92696 RepID=A0A4R0RHF7_9APHY|nr:hypothetical protein EIP91_003007 [Steccherinum ochraceum]
MSAPDPQPVVQVVAEGAPPTRFADRLQRDIDPIGRVSWSLVVSEEPEKVAAWLLYLHRREHRIVYELAVVLTDVLKSVTRKEHPQQCKIWAQTRLACVVMDLVMEPGMFSDDEDSFKNLVYGSQLLSLLRFSLRILVGKYDVPYKRQYADRHDRDCAKDLLTRMEAFINAMWNLRHLIPKNPTSDADLGRHHERFLQFASPAHKCVLTMTQIYDKEHKRTPPPQMRAAHFVLYYWTYSPNVKDCVVVQKFLHYSITDHQEDPSAFALSVLRAHPAFGLDLSMKICSLLRDEECVDYRAQTLMSICAHFVQHAPELFARIATSGGKGGLIPSMMFSCQRQMCSSPESTYSIVVHYAMESFLHFFRIRETGPDILHNFGSYAAEYNFISILSCARVWHDTIARLKSVRPSSATQRALKAKALTTWREYGDDICVKEGVNVITLKEPSQLCDFEPYWDITRRCFWKHPLLASAAPALVARGRVSNLRTSGSATTGNSGNANGGSVANVATGESAVFNGRFSRNRAGDGGRSISGDAIGGNGIGGGNAVSGNSGNANGGDVLNEATGESAVINLGSNHAGNGGTSRSGDAIGGNSYTKRSSKVDALRYKYKSFTPPPPTSGSATSGSSGDANGGSVANIATGESTIRNNGHNTAGDGGRSISGDAIGGNGVNGGSAKSGNAGNANGGDVINEATGKSKIINNGSNRAGDGGVSRSGDAIGGNSS